MLAFSITASSLELANSGAIFPADSSISTTSYPVQRVSFVLYSGMRAWNPPPHTFLFVEFPGLDSNQA
jgi:hypothetical protein